MSIKDYYKTLEIERTASKDDIKKAFYRLVKLYHPDKNPDNQNIYDKFVEIIEAYRILGDLENRLIYSAKLSGLSSKDFNEPKRKKNRDVRKE